MEQEAIWELVREKAAVIFEREPVMDAELKDLDSLGVVELAMDLEDATGVELAESDVVGTVGDLLDLVAARTGKTEP